MVCVRGVGKAGSAEEYVGLERPNPANQTIAWLTGIKGQGQEKHHAHFWRPTVATHNTGMKPSLSVSDFGGLFSRRRFHFWRRML